MRFYQATKRISEPAFLKANSGEIISVSGERYLHFEQLLHFMQRNNIPQVTEE